MLKMQYVGRGMHLEFHHPEYHQPIVTSPIQAIRDYVEPMAGAGLGQTRPTSARAE